MSTRRTSNLRISTSLILSVSIALAAHAAAPSNADKSDVPADYAFSLPLQISGKQGVVGLNLPQTVYLNAQSAHLDDLRVFDAKGVVQPFSLQRPLAETQTQRSYRRVSVFPIRSRATVTADSGVELDIRTGADGKVISVRTNGEPAGGNDEQATADGPLSGLVLDFGPPFTATRTDGEKIAALRFAPPPEATNYNAEVWLEISKDLKTWETVGAADIGWLTNDDAQTLANDRLEFAPINPQTHRYARLTWRKGDPVVFPAIEAERVAVHPREAQRETLWIQPTAGKIGSDLAYSASIALPVDQISLRLSEPNVVFPMTLGRYVERPTRVTGRKTEWAFQPMFRSTFYQIEQNEQTRRSAPLDIGLTQMAEWIVRPQNAAATAKPELGLSWQADTLVFLAGGTPPYRLYFGRADAVSGSQPLAQVAPGFSVNELKRLEQAALGEIQRTEGGTAGETAAELAKKAARNRQLALWGLLLIGVLVLAGMTWRLIQQMKAKGQDKPTP